jgi:hypothetical protein
MRAFLKWLEREGELAEYYIETKPPPQERNTAVARSIREASRALGTPRSEVEEAIKDRFEFYGGRHRVQPYDG